MEPRDSQGHHEGTLFVVDDDPRARAGVAALASSLSIVCEHYASAEEFLERLDPVRSGCLLLDYRLDGTNGLDLQEELLRRGNAMPVIFISAYADVPMAVRAMQNGALTVLEKPYRDDLLVEAVRRGLEMDNMSRQAATRRNLTARRLNSLDDREREFMELMITGTPNKNIARILSVSHRTADRIRATIYEKMGVESAAEVASLVAEVRAVVTAVS
jgi:FixJ family two-component response regulator